MTQPLIALQQLHVSLSSRAGKVDILRGVDLSVARGETLGLVGPSGSGKSTLLMVMAGLEPPTSGKVAVAGCDLQSLDEDARATFRRRHIGIVFQSFHLIAGMTALENVALPLELAGHAGGFERAAAALDAVGLTARAAHYPVQMSGGEQQRTALARALVTDPPLLLADEPTGNLDRATGESVMALIAASVAERNMTLVLVTHDAALAESCDRVVTLRDGQLVS